MKEVSQAGVISLVTQRSSLRWVSLGFPRLKWQCFQPVMEIAPVTVVYVVYCSSIQFCLFSIALHVLLFASLLTKVIALLNYRHDLHPLQLQLFLWGVR